MRTQSLWLVPAVAIACYGQTESAISREGKYWVQTSTGSVSVQGDLLRISTRGPVTIQGESRSDIAYTLTKRVRASDEASARRELSGILVKTAGRGPGTTLIVTMPHRNQASADLRVSVPRTLRETELESQGGSVTAQDLDGSLKAETGGGEMRIDRIQGDVMLNTGGGNLRLGRIGRTVRCSLGGGTITAESIGGEAHFSTGGGSIFVSEASAPVRASTGGGNIKIERAAAQVTVSTGGGNIEAAQLGGPITAETGAGAIKIRSAQGLRCETGTGAIQLYAVSGRLRAATGMGSILAELAAGKPLEDSVLSTGSGDVTVFFPSNLAVTVQAISDSPGLQRIVSDFAEIRPRSELHAGRTEAQGALNGGGPLLKVTATNGTIYLRRQK